MEWSKTVADNYLQFSNLWGANSNQYMVQPPLGHQRISKPHLNALERYIYEENLAKLYFQILTVDTRERHFSSPGLRH